MPSGGPYIRFSDLYDRKPSGEEVVDLIEDLDCLHTVLLLTRLTTQLRHALFQRDEGDLAWIQGFFAFNFLDDDVKARIESRVKNFGAVRPACHPLQLFNLLRLSLGLCRGCIRPDVDETARKRLGKALLMENDLLLTSVEEQRILVGEDDDRRLDLMVQMLAPMELLNPTPPRHLLVRGFVLYHKLLRDGALCQTIRQQCRGLQILEEFEKQSGIHLYKWLNLLVATWTHFMHPTQTQLTADSSLFILNPAVFLAHSKVKDSDFRALLNAVSISFEALQLEMAQQRPVDPRVDLVPIKARPLCQINEYAITCLDTALLVEKMFAGVHWLIHDGLNTQQERRHLFSAWGLLFEKYVGWLFAGLQGRHGNVFLSDISWKNGDKSFDGLLLKGHIIAVMEYKGGFLRQDAKYALDREKTLADIESKYVAKGCHQLALHLERMFPSGRPRPRFVCGGSSADHIDMEIPEAVKSVMPILVVQDAALSGLLVNWWLNKRFQEELACRQVSTDLRILPLTVIQVDELETMVESAESGDFDFTGTIERRCSDDPDMLSQLQDFLFAAKGFPTERSERFEEIHARDQKQLIEYLFFTGELSD